MSAANQSINKFLGAMFWNQLGRMGEVVLSLSFVVLIVRTLSGADFATYSTATNFGTFGLVVIGLGYSDGLLRYVPVLRAWQPQAPYRLFRRILLRRLVVGIIAGLLIFFMRVPLAVWLHQPVFDRDCWVVIALLLLYSLFELLIFFYSALLRVKQIELIRLAGQLFNILILLVLLQFISLSAVSLLLSLCLTNLAMLGVALVWLPLTRLFQTPGGAELTSQPEFAEQTKNFFPFSRTLWLTNLATLGLLGQVDIFVLSLFSPGSEAVINYSLAALLTGRLYIAILAWSGSLGSIIATVAVEKGQAGLARYFVYYYRFSLAVYLLPMVGLAALSRPLISLLFGAQHVKVDEIAGLVTIFVVQHALGALFAGSISGFFINNLDLQHLALRLRWICSLLNLGLDLVLAPAFGATGVVIATTLANGLFYFGQFWLLRRLEARPGYIYSLKIGLGALGGGGLAYVVPGDGPGIMVVKAGLYLGFLVAFFKLVRPLTEQDKALISGVRPGLTGWLRFL